MKTLSISEIQAISGGSVIRDMVDEAKEAVDKMAGGAKKVIEGVGDIVEGAGDFVDAITPGDGIPFIDLF